ncbi:MAG: 2-hydroxyglutaryl-CoA dehydratase, partial [Oscillospiraceae bacterium]|nr:2-hydroxyglutaryl-CoA dehydratase [Oscillospiraceae bacterium]
MSESKSNALSDRICRAGIDIGSTTAKLVILDEDGKLLFGSYQRHHARTREALTELLQAAQGRLGDIRLSVCFTGSGALGLSQSLGLPFLQEVVAVAEAIEAQAPQTDVAIELGGEDAKIIYFRGGLDERMNGVCAGGTGSFIDQMAALLNTDAAGLNESALSSTQRYTIASRCGVFAKSDIQPLINEGASREDLAASIFQSVVNQTVSGLACGKPIRGNVAFLGGPLHYLSELRAAFIRTLRLTPEQVIVPENSHLFAAVGAAIGGKGAVLSVSELIAALQSEKAAGFEVKRLEPLFESEEDYRAFRQRHAKAKVRRQALSDYSGDCFLGVDAGSTTTKLALIAADGSLLFSSYAGNGGNPVEAARRALTELTDAMPEGARIAGSCSTGYGEALMKAAFRLDDGEVETVAHSAAAAFFDPEVDCVLDIGGQDMKCIRLKDQTV